MSEGFLCVCVCVSVCARVCVCAGPALGIGDIGGRLERHLLEGRREAPLQQNKKNLKQ